MFFIKRKNQVFADNATAILEALEVAYDALAKASMIDKTLTCYNAARLVQEVIRMVKP